MELSRNRETIAAVATAPGRGALAAVRLSGPGAFAIVRKLLSAEAAERLQPRKAVVVDLYAPDSEPRRLLDRCVLVPYVAPNSYTGEDMIEIFTHGGSYVPQLVVENLIAAGARLAQPGEFTLRAFLNDKMDLAQAESIEAIVSARTRRELELAQQHYSGQFSREIERLRGELVDLLSLLELELDFAEEDVDFASRDELRQRLHELRKVLLGMVRAASRVHLIREGIYTAIVGRPNVGKSSLLNVLLQRERAIVTDVPGTTRDVIEEQLEIGGQRFVFADTAGIRQAQDEVEQEGIRRSDQVLQRASVVALLIDVSTHLGKEDWEVRQRVLQNCKDDQRYRLLVLNKCDLPRKLTPAELEKFESGFERVEISCRTGEGLAELEEKLIAAATALTDVEDGVAAVPASLRQKEAAQRALEAVQEAESHLDAGLSQEFIAADLRAATEALAEIIGQITTEDVLGNIFANFCIGK